MKIKDNWLIIVILLLVLGVVLYYERKPIITDPPPHCVWVKMDPNSSRTYTAILMPKLNETYGQIEELKAQNQWLRDNLNKCLEKLETEKGLESIPLDHNSLSGDGPKLAGKYSQPPETWFKQYEEPNVSPLLEGPESNIRFLIYLMGIREGSNRLFIDVAGGWIENFEERMKRLDPNQPK